MKTCTTCGGKGRLKYERRLLSDPHLAVCGEDICPACDGSGEESPLSVSRPLDAVRAETIQAVFDWIKNHTDIKDESGNVIPDAYIDARDIKLSDFLREHGI